MNDAAIPDAIEEALAHHRAGRLAQAEALYRQVLQRTPNHARALHLMGVLMQQRGNGPAAEGFVRQAIAADPGVAGFYNDLGIALRSQGRPAEAVAAYEKALELKPDFPEVRTNLGNALNDLGRHEAAAASHRAALALRPTLAAAHNGLGLALRDMGRREEAIASYREALALNPNYAEAHNNLGVASKESGALDEAIASYRAALAIRPNYPDAYNNLGNACFELGELEEAIDCYREAMLQKPDYDADLYSNYLMVAQYSPEYAVEDLVGDHRHFGNRFGAPLCARWPTHTGRRLPAGPGRKLKLGFVSGDLREHPVGYFLEGVLAHLDRRLLDVSLYSTVTARDELTDRLVNTGATWRTLVGMSDDAAAAMLQEEGIDILVDLAGHTAHNALLLFARKPAPVQVAWLGYFATTGLEAIDYLIADPHSVFESEADTFVEKIWTLPETRLCFTPPSDDIAVGPLPALRNQAITFGCFNNLTKVNAEVVRLWARVLQALPGSCLMLKVRQLDNANIRRATLARFAEHGIAAERLLLRGNSSRAEYLATYNEIDICLDPFPFTGATTTVEGLWMGVPLITRRGDRLLARQGESILHNLGLTEWIAADDDAYVECAVKHAASPERLAQLRAGLRSALVASPLCDAPRFARHLETAFHGMWQAYCSQTE